MKAIIIHIVVCIVLGTAIATIFAASPAVNCAEGCIDV